MLKGYVEIAKRCGTVQQWHFNYSTSALFGVP